jgi:predicted transcriptional regulator
VNNLTKLEYQILTEFYQNNKIMTKSELIERNPELKPNTIMTNIRNLHKKGYLEVTNICQKNAHLSAAYRPKLPIKCFYDSMFSPKILESLIEKIVAETEDVALLAFLLDKVRTAKENLVRQTPEA